jgi:hypothetical protein
MPRTSTRRARTKEAEYFPALLRQAFFQNLSVLADEDTREAMKDPEFREAVRRAAREISRGMQKMIAKWDEEEQNPKPRKKRRKRLERH